MANTIVYKEDFAVTLQEKLTEKKFWNTFGAVTYTDVKVFNNPYKNDPTVASYTRGAQFTYTDVTLTNETLDIATSAISAEFIDLADMAQNGYDLQIRLAEDQGDELMDEVEEAFLGEYANAGTVLDGTDIGEGAGDIALDADNAFAVARAARQKIVEGKGLRAFDRDGAVMIVRPKDYNVIVGAAQAAGVLGFAESALTGGTVNTVNGFEIYESNLLTVETSTAHCLAMVKGSIDVGILNTTFGKVTIDDKNPDNRSAIGFVSRIDYGTKVFTQKAPFIVDIPVVE